MKQIPLTVADRLLDPAVVINAVGADGEATSLSHGLAGTALLHARLSAVDPRYATAAVRHWRTAAGILRDHPSGFTGIQGGRGGLAASFILGTPYLPEPDRCRPHAAQSAKWLAASATHLADHPAKRPPETGPPWHVYDAITGLTGIGRVLLAADHNGHDVAHGLLSALHTLTDILAPRDHPRPGWWLAAADHPLGPTVDPSGAATTGLAHGVAGPLALLASAHLAGWTVTGQTEAIAHAADWLLHYRHQDGTWPPAVTGTELDTDTAPATRGRADAWCYGTPGITHALHEAGNALNLPGLSAATVSALDSMAARRPGAWDVEGPTLCHGYAGVLQSAPDHPVGQAAAEATVASFDPAHPFGFQHHHREQTHDEPGFLTGAAGIALALTEHKQVPGVTAPTSWDSLLNLTLPRPKSVNQSEALEITA